MLTYDDDEDAGWEDFLDSFSTKSGDEKTYYKKATKEVVAYVPETVCEDIDSLLGKEITVLFGEDNTVAIIKITNDSTFDSAYIEKYKYNEDKGRVTIDGKEYKFATKAVVAINTIEKTDYTADPVVNDAAKVMDTLRGNLGETDDKDFVKLVKANAILNSDEEITRLDVYVSGSYADYNTFEAIVTKNRNDELTYYYCNVANVANPTWVKATFDYEDLSSKEMPKVYKDGKAIDITDIEVNNVLTVYGDAADGEIDIIYVSEETVTGEVTKTQKAENKIYIDGESYKPSIGLFYTDKELSKGGYTVGVVGTDVSKDDEVTAYLNIYGEYVVVSTDAESTGDFTIGYVIAEKEADADGDTITRKIRVLLEDGTKPWYTITAEEDDDISFDDVNTAVFKGKVIAFEANSDSEIEIDELADIIEIAKVNDETLEKTFTTDADFERDYDVDAFEIVVATKTVALSTVEDALAAGYTNPQAGDMVKLNGGTYSIAGAEDEDVLKVVNDIAINDTKTKINDYRFRDGRTVVFDIKAANKITKWDSILDADKELIGNAVIICEADETDIKYMFVYTTEDSISDAMYAVASTIYDDEAVLLTEDGTETIEYTKTFDGDDLGEEEGFVVYQTDSKGKIKKAAMLVDVYAFNELATNGSVDATIVTGDADFGVTLEVNLGDAEKEHFEVDTLDTGIYELSYKDDISEALDHFATIDVDKDSIVYDLRDGKFVVGDLDDLATILSTDSVYVIPFANGDCDDDADANILVVLD